ncbi:hypothetical protein M422DRAFT_26737 [Sphaerobolus stellatus SS14]|nr:hypothetical protein M422DRAFT_26737 [Sphaerobolus stellatus SS14]
MSAYGPSAPRHGPLLLPKCLPLKKTPRITSDNYNNRSLSVHHLTLKTVPPQLADLLYSNFQDELERGATYPQEYPITRSAFDSYFLGNDCFVGIVHPAILHSAPEFIEEAQGDRRWEDCFAGAYYVKPNYPGRSSHICNAGFLVVPSFRGMGIATALAKTYVENAPLLGYKASIFNLVYVNNIASVRIWEGLGFSKVGRIPSAGRLKRQGELEGEEYVDAWVVYKSFEESS